MCKCPNDPVCLPNRVRKKCVLSSAKPFATPAARAESISSLPLHVLYSSILH